MRIISLVASKLPHPPQLSPPRWCSYTPLEAVATGGHVHFPVVGDGLKRPLPNTLNPPPQASDDPTPPPCNVPWTGQLATVLSAVHLPCQPIESPALWWSHHVTAILWLLPFPQRCVVRIPCCQHIISIVLAFRFFFYVWCQLPEIFHLAATDPFIGYARSPETHLSW